MPARRTQARRQPARTLRTRWPRRAPRGFDGHAKRTDRAVRKKARALAADLADVRDQQRDAFLAATGLDAVAKGKRRKKDGQGADADPLTLSQEAAIRAALDEIDGGAYTDVLFDELSAMVHASYAGAAELLDVGTSFDAPPVWAIDKVQAAADHVGSLIDERDKAALTQVLDDALTEGLGAQETAARLRDAFDTVRAVADDGSVRETPSDSWFKTVARTELQDAAVSGQHALYQAAGIKTVRIQCAAPCDFCAQYDDQVFPIDDVPEGGPPWHPNCCCTEVPNDEDLGDWRGTEEDRAAAARGNADAEEE